MKIQQLLMQDYIQEGLNQVLRFQPKSVLDLGCGTGHSLAVLHHNCFFERLVGVDMWSEQKVIDYYKSKKPELNVSTLYEIYKLVKPSKLIPESEFRNKLVLHYDTPFDVYFEKMPFEQFDMVILQDVLHIKGNKDALEYILVNAFKRLNAWGLFYVAVNHIDNIRAGLKGQDEYTEDEFAQIFLHPGLHAIDFNLNYTVEGTSIKTMYYLGIKINNK